jgi:restriction system protein
MSDDRKDGSPAPSAEPKGNREGEPDKAVPFFLNDGSSNMTAILAWHKALAADTGVFGPMVFEPLNTAVEAALPSLLLQTVIVPGARTNEGTLIEAVALPWFDIIEFLKTDPSIAFQIPWEKWEEIIAGAYKKAGFEEVTLTPRSGDYGRDVIAIKKGICSIRVIEQVKAYKPPHLVAANDVRALMGVLEGDGASKACLSTTSDFAPMIKTDPLMARFIPSRLELVNGTALFSRLEELAARQKT